MDVDKIEEIYFFFFGVFGELILVLLTRQLLMRKVKVFDVKLSCVFVKMNF